VERRFLLSFAVAGTAVLSIGLGAGPAGAAEPGGAECSPGLVPATVTPIYAHIEKAHLERSPMMQVHDAEQTGDYLAMHEAWIQTFTAPARDGAPVAAGASSTRAVGQVQQSPGSAPGASNPDAFVLRETTGVQGALDPVEALVTGSPC
jgi:hypothetical protein